MFIPFYEVFLFVLFSIFRKTNFNYIKNERATLGNSSGCSGDKS